MSLYFFPDPFVANEMGAQSDPLQGVQNFQFFFVMNPVLSWSKGQIGADNLVYSSISIRWVVISAVSEECILCPDLFPCGYPFGKA